MRKLKPDTVTGNLGKPSVDQENDSEFRRALIATKARIKPKEKFNNLLHHLTPELVGQCLAKIPYKSAPGVDRMTVSQAEKNLDWLLPPQLDAIHKGRYEAPPVRRVYIPKGTNGKRPIGVPQIIDRSIQAGMAKILNEIYEQDFLSCSFGFRPKIGCHHALSTINEIQYKWKLNYALEVDIRDFFGSLKHDWLRKFLSLRIGDKRVLKLIDAWLEAGVMEDGNWRESENGTPQGGSISPILSNIYLHYVLDLWFERKIKRRLNGRAYLVRYADDFLILFKNKEDMENVKPLLTARLAQFGLSVADEKTHMTNLTPRTNPSGKDRRRINFLGFNIFRAPNRSGTGWKTVFQTEGKRFTRAKAKIKEKMFKMMHAEVGVQAKVINSMLVGHFNYYGIAGNRTKLQNFWHFVKCYWRRCLSRRSQKGYTNWKEMDEVLEKHPLITPRVKVPYKTMNQYVRL